MENLNDVEFGSDKSGEEAPILVAQRYLNIFRQVHIFNKAKRDEFDDELLALPQNITDFFKRMPGGRLLVEHIEKVKTERGIAFVKAKKEDFEEGSGMTDTPQPAANGTVQAVAGSVTLDASFANALAQALANAFKQLPQSPVATASGTGPTTISADFGNAFDVIAEEIRTSRASLLDVLKETRSITDSVIASQVSISRILEGILATRDRDDTDIADLNNRIIASQASITKLLEGLYTASNKKNAEISEYLNVENRLRRFREEITSDLDISLQKMQELFRLCAQSIQDRKVIIETRPSHSGEQAEVIANDSHVEVPASSFADNSRHPATDMTATMKVGDVLTQVQQQTKPSEQRQTYQEVAPHIQHENKNPVSTSFHSDSTEAIVRSTSDYPVDDTLAEHRKKKKKKKKNRENVFINDSQAPLGVVSPVYTPVSEQVVQSQHEPEVASEENVQISKQDKKEPLPSFDGVIRNKAFKHEDRFDNVHLDVPPLDLDGENEATLSHEHIASKAQNVSEAKVSDNVETQSTISNQKIGASDDLDFELPDVPSDFADMSEDNNSTNIGHISNLSETADIEDDDLDFALPEVNFSNEDIADSSSSMSFDDISQPEQDSDKEMDFADSFNDGLDFSLPDIDDGPTQNNELQSFSDGASADVAHSGEEYAPKNQDERDIEPDVSVSQQLSSEKETDITSPLDNFMALHNEDISAQSMPQATMPVADSSALSDTLSNTEKEEAEPSLDDLLNGTKDGEHPISEQSMASANVSPADTDVSASAPDTVSSAEETPSLDDLLGGSDKKVIAPDVSANRAPTLDDFMNSHNQEIEASDADMTTQSAAKEPSLDDFLAEPAQTDSQTNVISQTDETSPVGDVAISSSPVSHVSEEVPADTNRQNSPHEHDVHQSRYSAELDKIREALTSDSVDLSSLDQPIALDDYSDDENVGKDDYDDILSHLSESHENTSDTHIASDAQISPTFNSGTTASAPEVSQQNSESPASDDEQDWEWEYVDENGNEVPDDDDQDWEWEYVEDDDTTNADDNKK